MANLGSTLGGVLGGAAGGILGGGNPAMIATGYSAGTGIGGLLESSIQKKKAMGMDVQTMSPLEATYLDGIRAKQRALEAGVMYQPQQQAIQQAGTTAMRAATRVAGGDIGGTVAALQKISRGTGKSLNELYGQMMNQSTQLLGMEGQAIQPIAQRQYLQSQWDKSQQLVDAVQKEKDAKQIIAAVIAKKLAGTGIDLESEEGKSVLERLFAEWEKRKAISTTTAVEGLGQEIKLDNSLMQSDLLGQIFK
jgi:hypothetical protein